MRRKVMKAVFPVAGLGTRFLPATKSIPKEIMTLVDRPLIQYAIDEARAAGMTARARLDGALNVVLQTVCPGNRAGHGDLPTDADVASIVAVELAPDPPRTPTAADCVSS